MGLRAEEPLMNRNQEAYSLIELELAFSELPMRHMFSEALVKLIGAFMLFSEK
jgi:hypothetical protein